MGVLGLHYRVYINGGDADSGLGKYGGGEGGNVYG